MKRFALVTVLLLAGGLPLAAQQPQPPAPTPPVVVEEPTAVVSFPRDPVKAGVLVELDATRSLGAEIRWNLIVRSGLRPDAQPPGPQLFRVYECGRKASFATPDQGVYTFVVSVGAKTGAVATTQFDVVVGPPPAPPAPPAPPTPPLPPAPAEPKLTVELRDLYRGDPYPAKATAAAAIAASWRQVGTSLTTDKSVTKFSDALVKVRNEIKSKVPGDDTLRPMRERIANELDELLGTNPSRALTDELRATFRDAFVRIADSLEAAIKP